MEAKTMRSGSAIPAAGAWCGTRERSGMKCRAREMLDRVGDKWSVHIINILGDGGTMRFSELRRHIEGISHRMLTVTLRGLERDGLVHRTVYPEIPPRVEYALTPLGATLRDIVRMLIDWSEAHLAEVDAARARYDARVSRQRAEGFPPTISSNDTFPIP